MLTGDEAEHLDDSGIEPRRYVGLGAEGSNERAVWIGYFEPGCFAPTCPRTSPHRSQCKQETALMGSPPHRWPTPTTRTWRRFPHLQTGGLGSARR